jgi:hypothetical protein
MHRNTDQIRPANPADHLPATNAMARDDAANQGEPQPTPAIALWTPSLLALLVSGAVSGTILGAADGVLFFYLTGGFASVQIAAFVSAGLSLIGGVVVVLIRRAIWGPDVSVEVGTVLGMLYGIVPGGALLLASMAAERVFDPWSLAGAIMASSMAGLLVGGVLDRITDAVVMSEPAGMVQAWVTSTC